MSHKDSESAPLSSPLKPETESKLLVESALLLINWPKSPPQEKTYFYLEAPEIEKLKDISVYTPDKRDLTPLPESEQKVENGKELEEEDDHNDCSTI